MTAKARCHGPPRRPAVRLRAEGATRPAAPGHSRLTDRHAATVAGPGGARAVHTAPTITVARVEPANRYPVTIVAARYGGVYEPGLWLAFACYPDALPSDWNAGDGACADFWRLCRHEIGGGDSPDDALADLLRKEAGRRRR